ncbi:hypothetical protein LJC43_04585 [Parabacteroides sp. OttesenSCG-928-G21]|nr:hypothetical protein [Parabacteroides sp. OttesenSCG-928-G21]
MIDFVKVFFTRKHEIDKYIKSKGHKCTYLGGREVYKLQLYNLELVSTATSAYMHGSLHSFCNAIKGDGLRAMNWNDFSYDELLSCLDILQNELDYDLTYTKLTVVEFGFNIELNMNATDFIDKHVFMYKYKSPCYNPKNRTDMKMQKYEYEDYTIKVYDKAKHFKLSRSLLRYEVLNKTDELGKSGVVALNDLRRATSIDALYKSCMIKYENLMVIDSYNGYRGMPKAKRDLLTKYTHPQFWESLKEGEPYDKRKHKLVFNKIVEDYKLHSAKDYLRELIYKKYNILITKFR